MGTLDFFGDSFSDDAYPREKRNKKIVYPNGEIYAVLVLLS